MTLALSLAIRRIRFKTVNSKKVIEWSIDKVFLPRYGEARIILTKEGDIATDV